MKKYNKLIKLLEENEGGYEFNSENLRQLWFLLIKDLENILVEYYEKDSQEVASRFVKNLLESGSLDILIDEIPEMVKNLESDIDNKEKNKKAIEKFHGVDYESRQLYETLEYFVKSEDFDDLFNAIHYAASLKNLWFRLRELGYWKE